MNTAFRRCVMTAAMTVPPTTGLRSARLAVRGAEATCQWDARAFAWQRLFEVPDDGVEFAVRGAR
jgi:hypothetical protein